MPIGIIVCLCIMGFAGYKLWSRYAENQAGEEAYADLEQYIVIPTPLVETNTPEPEPSATEEPDRWAYVQWPEVNFDELASENEDIVGWLYCEGTIINYPVVQGEDNDYYLRHLFDGSYNKAGCLFMDSRNSSDLSDWNSIIYGHHLQSGKMLASLDGYKRQEYYDEHPLLLFMTPEENYVIEVFAGHVAKVSDTSWDIGFASDDELMQWSDAAIEKSTFESEVIPAPGDRIITLSTCSYEFNDARYVLLGILHKAATLDRLRTPPRNDGVAV